MRGMYKVKTTVFLPRVEASKTRGHMFKLRGQRDYKLSNRQHFHAEGGVYGKGRDGTITTLKRHTGQQHV